MTVIPRGGNMGIRGKWTPGAQPIRTGYLVTVQVFKHKTIKYPRNRHQRKVPSDGHVCMYNVCCGVGGQHSELTSKITRRA